MGFEPFSPLLLLLPSYENGTQENKVAFQDINSCRCYSRVHLDVSIQAAVLTPCSVSELSEAFSFTRPLLLHPPALPMFLLTSSLVLSSHFLLPEALYPFDFSLLEPFSLPPSLVTLSCHPPSSLPIRICSAGDQSQRDVFSSTAAITQNSISPNLK